MAKKEKIEKYKHYFTLKNGLNAKFMKHLDENFLNKQKLIEGLIIQYLEKNNINLND